MGESTARSRQPDSIGQVFLWALLSTLVLFLNVPDATYAQVTTNITPSALPACPGPCGAGVTIVTPLPPGQGGTITITGGARPGGDGPNLFHSFGQFDVGPHDIANFFNETGLHTSNILSRVTGGNLSQIYGTIQTTDFPGANLFLMNPAGVLFGATAVLDLGAVTYSAVRQPGSFYATTADYLKLGDANGTSSFYADLAQASVLSVAPVAAFGFLALEPGVTRGTISVQGSILEIPQGHALSLVGGDISIQAASLHAPGGQINLVSVASPGEVLVPSFQTGPNIKGASFTTMGKVTIKEGATLDVSGQLDVDAQGNPIGGNSGTVFVRGGQLVMDASTIVAGTMGAVDGARTAVDIQVSQDVALTNSFIVTFTSGLGRGGDVQLTAGTLTMANDPFGLFTLNGGGGVGGDVVLNVGTLSLMGGSSIQSWSQNSTPGSGQGGNVIIRGLPGAEFGAAKLVTFSEGSSLVSLSSGKSDGGRVAITAESLTMDGAATTVSSTANDVGHGGEIVVGVQEAHLQNGATISTLTVIADPNAPTAATVTVQGLQGEGSMADIVTLSRGSGIASDTQGIGRSGNVAVHAKTISLTEGAAIQAGTLNTTGAGGEVTLHAASVDISGGSRIASQARESNAGKVTITANELTLDNGSIETKTIGGGLGGNVVLEVGSVSLSNGATINSSATGTGRAGDITITGKSLTLANHSEITSSSKGTVANAGDAGTITITTTGNTVSLASGSSITSSTIGAGNAGQVIVTTPALSLNDATITTSTSSSGNAGGITANVGTLSLANGSRISSASTGETITNLDGTTKVPGTAGTITITDAGSFTSDASTLATSAEANHGGDISITAHNVQLSGGTLITANSNAPLKVTKLVLDANGQLDPKPQVVGDGNAGNITIHSGSNVVMNNSSITTEASQASGGQIEITAPEMVRLINSRVSTSVAGSATDTAGGNITIDPPFVILQNSQIIAKAVAGSGGKIKIIASVFLKDPRSIVDASSTLGISGTVNIESPVQNIGGRLTPLSQQFSSAAALLAQRCAARVADGKFSTFVVAGREGLPVEPGGFLASPSLTAELLGSSLAGWYPHTPIAAVTGLFPEYDARPIQLAKFGNACRQ